MTGYLNALFGGALIGLSAAGMLLFNGKILGVSGILGEVLQKRTEKTWRYLFLMGLLTGGAVVLTLQPEAFSNSLSRSPEALIVAGLLVGFGTRLGNGCTSGHGICGISRLSPRSLIATLTFMGCGGAVVYIINHILGGRV